MLVASFSGGRSSAMMISQMDLSDAMVIFCNTGKEMPQTLDFVRDCEQHWQVPVVWLEYRSRYDYSVVDYETASRNGEPFEQLIADRWGERSPKIENSLVEKAAHPVNILGSDF